MSFPKDVISSEKSENLNAFFNQYKRRFFDWHSLKRPVYTLKLDQEGKIVHDKNGILVVLVKSYVQGELKATKQLLYREAVDGGLSSLHYIKGVLGEDTWFPRGVKPWVGYSIKNMYLRVFSTLLGPSWLDAQHVNASASPSCPHKIFSPPFQTTVWPYWHGPKEAPLLYA